MSVTNPHSRGGVCWRCANCGEESTDLPIGKGFQEDSTGSVRAVTLHLQDSGVICGEAWPSDVAGQGNTSMREY